MSDRLIDAFKFRGRLSFAGRQRLERKLMAIAVLPFLALAALVVADQLQWAPVPFLLFVPLGIALTSAHVRRLHDLGLTASSVWLRYLLVCLLAAAPISVALFSARLPDWVRVALAAMSVVIVLAVMARSLFVLPLDWRRGDPEPNRFGPPPA